MKNRNNLEIIPGVSKNIAEDLRNIGVQIMADTAKALGDSFENLLK